MSPKNLVRQYGKSSAEETKRSKVLATRPDSQRVPGQEATAITFVRAAGPYLFDLDGNRYIDFDNGKGSVMLGHNDPDITSALVRAIEASVEIITGPTPLLLQVAEHIVADTQQDFQVAFFKTGNAATRAAITAARRFTKHDLVLSSGWHGWDPCWSAGEAPLVPNRDNIIDFYFCLDWLEKLLVEYRSDIAAVIFSPDHMYLSADYYRQLFELCAHHDVRIIADEVKVGYRYRAGSSLRELGLVADMYTFSKGLSNGTHLSCVAGVPEIMSHLSEVSYTSYFECLPLVAASAVLSKLKATNAYSIIQQKGDQFLDKLRKVVAETELPMKIYGNGNIFRTVFGDRELALAFYEQSLQQGGLFYVDNNQCPSLATVDVFDEALVILSEVLDNLKKQYGGLRGKTIALHDEWDAAWNQMDGFPELAFSADEQERLAFVRTKVAESV